MRLFIFTLVAFLAPVAARAESESPSTITAVSVKDEQPARSARLRKPSQKPAPPPATPVELVALNSHESFELRPGPQGGFGHSTMRSLAHFLRCHHTQRVHAINERLARLLYQVSNHFGYAKLEVVAGYRAPKIAKAKGNPKSPHKRGLACDFRVDGVTNEVVRDYVRTLPKVGVGYYPNSGFVHMDVRDLHSAFWVDYSGPGERAQYSKTPDEDVKKMAAESDPDAEGVDPQEEDSPRAPTPKLPALEAATPQQDE